MSIVHKANIDIGGINYLIVSDDDYLRNMGQSFEPEMVKLFRHLVSGHEVVLDIGANIGCTALLFGEIAKKVYAFEPSETTFAFLKKNIAHSGWNNITALNVGLGAEQGETTLTFAPNNRSGGFVSDQTQASVGHTVEKIVIRQLDEVANEQKWGKVDFIKMDVEGFEGNVLRGGVKTLEANKPVLVLELNHWCLNAFQRTSIPDFFDLLRSIFPILLAIDSNYYMDLHNESNRYGVMYRHILYGQFPNVIACFDEAQLRDFRVVYQHGEPPL